MRGVGGGADEGASDVDVVASKRRSIAGGVDQNKQAGELLCVLVYESVEGCVGVVEAGAGTVLI